LFALYVHGTLYKYGHVTSNNQSKWGNRNTA